MATTKETATIVMVMLAIGSVGLLAATAAKAGGMRPGDIERQGEAESADGQQYQWRIIKSFPGAQGDYTAQAKLAGFGTFDADTNVAMGDDAAELQDMVLSHIANLGA